MGLTEKPKKRFEKTRLYGELVSNASSELKDDNQELAELLTEGALVVLRAKTMPGQALKFLQKRVEEIAEGIVVPELVTPIKENEAAYDARLATLKRAQRWWRLADLLRYAVGGPFRRTCWCGAHTLSEALYPEGWATVSGWWVCPTHAPKRPEPKPLTPEQKREAQKFQRALDKMFFGGSHD